MCRGNRWALSGPASGAPAALVTLDFTWVSKNLGARRLRTFAQILCLVLMYKACTSAIWGLSEIGHGHVGYSALAVGLFLVPLLVLASLHRRHRPSPTSRRTTAG